MSVRSSGLQTRIARLHACRPTRLAQRRLPSPISSQSHVDLTEIHDRAERVGLLVETKRRNVANISVPGATSPALTLTVSIESQSFIRHF
ncbi:hypothetical protein CCR75_009464 [Bremia lactucae]|uniref:Uncharacterized protein n=1 Tax=Bremia lactucae TaxID=4779 RepID=A0A976FN54_BRELC|nr:hypothetical protein CCR75_009464 [Bremia lactucae]